MHTRSYEFYCVHHSNLCSFCDCFCILVSLKTVQMSCHVCTFGGVHFVVDNGDSKICYSDSKHIRLIHAKIEALCVFKRTFYNFSSRSLFACSHYLLFILEYVWLYVIVQHARNIADYKVIILVVLHKATTNIIHTKVTNCHFKVLQEERKRMNNTKIKHKYVFNSERWSLNVLHSYAIT